MNDDDEVVLGQDQWSPGQWVTVKLAGYDFKIPFNAPVKVYRPPSPPQEIFEFEEV